MSIDPKHQPAHWPKLRPIQLPKRLIVYAALGQALEAYHVDFMPHILGRCAECAGSEGRCDAVEFNLRVANALAEHALQDLEVRQAMRFAKLRTRIIDAAWRHVLSLPATRRAPTQVEQVLTEAFSEIIAAGAFEDPDAGGTG